MSPDASLLSKIHQIFLAAGAPPQTPFWPNLLGTYSAVQTYLQLFYGSKRQRFIELFGPYAKNIYGLLQPLPKRQRTSAVCEWGVLIFLIGTFFYIKMLIHPNICMHVHHLVYLVCSFCRVILERSYYPVTYRSVILSRFGLNWSNLSSLAYSKALRNS